MFLSLYRTLLLFLAISAGPDPLQDSAGVGAGPKAMDDSVEVGASVNVHAAAPYRVVAQHGLMDLRSWNFRNDGPVKLDGQWRFVWEDLVPPGRWPDSVMTTFKLPSIWNGHVIREEELSGKGYATYHLTILTAQHNELMALELPDFYCSYALWLNGKRTASNGIVGTNRRGSTPQWLPQTVVFRQDRDTLDLVLQVSNFYHASGGVNDHISLGLHDQLLRKREAAIITNIMLTGSLLLIGAFFVIVYFLFNKDRAALYFAAICGTWAVRSVFTSLYLFIWLFPGFDWELSVKIEYFSLYLTMMWSVLFVNRIFPQDGRKAITYSLVILNSLFIALTLATPAILYTHLLGMYQGVIWIVLIYITYVVLRALVYSRPGALFVASSVLVGVLMFAYDMLTYRQVFDFNPLIFNIGYMCIFLLNAAAFTYQLSLSATPRNEKIIDKDKLSYKDLTGTG